MSRKIESESVDGGVRNEMEEFGEYHQECIQLTNLVKEARLSVEKAKKFAVQLTEDMELCSDETTQLQHCIQQVGTYIGAIHNPRHVKPQTHQTPDTSNLRHIKPQTHLRI